MAKRRNITGLVAAITVVVCWLGAEISLLLFAEIARPTDLIWAVPSVLAMTFLHTGLFITAHDAMHGTVAPNSPRLNSWVGTMAVTLYALFSYRKLHHKHHEHHARPGIPGADPDFHDGARRGFWAWYAHFVWSYVGVLQILGMAFVFNVLSHGLHVAEPRLVLFWVVPALLSTLQLFYFGTYLPHREPHACDDPHRARSNAYPAWLSFLTCYHFGYHREHHEHPHVPWWALPRVRETGPREG